MWAIAIIAMFLKSLLYSADTSSPLDEQLRNLDWQLGCGLAKGTVLPCWGPIPESYSLTYFEYGIDTGEDTSPSKSEKPEPIKIK
jgi:hypothetical protein